MFEPSHHGSWAFAHQFSPFNRERSNVEVALAALSSTDSGWPLASYTAWGSSGSSIQVSCNVPKFKQTIFTGSRLDCMNSGLCVESSGELDSPGGRGLASVDGVSGRQWRESGGGVSGAPLLGGTPSDNLDPSNP